jgi:hypothetical protein
LVSLSATEQQPRVVGTYKDFSLVSAESAARNSSVFVVALGGIAELSLKSGDVTMWEKGDQFAPMLAVDASGVYGTEYGPKDKPSHLWRMVEPGKRETIADLANPPSMFQGLALSPRYVYWVTKSEVGRVGKDGKNRQESKLPELGEFDETGIATDGDRAFIALNLKDGMRILVWGPNDTSPRSVYEDRRVYNPASRIRARGDSVYFQDFRQSTNQGEILRVSIASGKADEIVLAEEPVELALSTDSLYYVGHVSGSVYRLRLSQ